MNPINLLNSSSLYFNAAQTAAAEAKRKEKAASVKTSFGKILEASKDSEKSFLIEQGLPIEIAGLSMEDAAVFLKDAVDLVSLSQRVSIT